MEKHPTDLTRIMSELCVIKARVDKLVSDTEIEMAAMKEEVQRQLAECRDYPGLSQWPEDGAGLARGQG